jgi:hypothetical protein
MTRPRIINPIAIHPMIRPAWAIPSPWSRPPEAANLTTGLVPQDDGGDADGRAHGEAGDP